MVQDSGGQPSLSVAMRDQHRPKQDLINDVTGLRKQIADLREAMTAHRRVEDALRQSEEQLRMLVDAAPVGLCLFRPNGSPLAANRPFARLLGYDTTAELLRLGDSLGVFGSHEEQGRVLSLVERGLERVAGVVFRRKDGTRQAFGVIGCEIIIKSSVLNGAVPQLFCTASPMLNIMPRSQGTESAEMMDINLACMTCHSLRHTKRFRAARVQKVIP